MDPQAVLLALGVTDSEHAFYSHDTGVDWDVIFLLLGMMIIVGVLRRTGVFEYVAIWAAWGSMVHDGPEVLDATNARPYGEFLGARYGEELPARAVYDRLLLTAHLRVNS